jgi:EmrB/QacA subfamily drug resistance transporter
VRTFEEPPVRLPRRAVSAATQNSATGSLPTVTPSETDAPRTGGSGIILYLSLGGLSFAVLQSLVAPALGVIGQDLGVTTGAAGWVLTANLLSAAVLTPIFGRLGDMVGKRRVLIVVLSLLLVGTVVAALAPNLGILIIGRILQGAAGAVMPLSIGIVRDEFPQERVSVTIGLLSAVFGIGAGAGILAAGPIVESLSWHWLFWLPAVLVIVALLGAIFGIRESPVRKPGRLDLLGTGILSIGLVSLLLSISEGQSWGWGDARTLGLFALGAVALAAFVLVELRVAEPLIDMRLFRHRGVWTAHVVALAFGFAMFGTFLLIPTLLQLPTALGFGFGKTVSEAGLYLLPTIVAMIVSGVVAGALIRRLGPKIPMLVGGVSVTVAYVNLGLGHAESWQILVSGTLTGIGIGMALAAISNAIVESVPAVQTGEAISANTVLRTIGSSIGTAVIAALISANVTAQGAPTDDAFTIGFWASAGVGVMAILAALLAPAVRRRHRHRRGDAVRQEQAVDRA